MTNYTFQSLFDFTRTTSGTFVGSNGLIQNTPASVNLLTWTQEFDNAAWTKGGASVSANSTVAPDGTSTADTLTEDTSTGDHRTFQNISVSNATPYTFSVYVKPNGRSLINLTLAGAGEATYNISTGVVTNTASGTAEIQPAGSGWYRCIIKFTSATTSYNAQIRLVSTGTTTSYTGNGTSGIFIWGAQLQTGSTATDYTRNNGGVFPPRFDYDPVTLAPKGILIEEQRVNLQTFSEQFNNAIWSSASSLTIAANTTVSPDGTSNADTGTRTTTGALENNIRAVTTQAVSTAVTFSVFVKANTAGARLYLRNIAVDTTQTTGVVQFNPADGTISTTFGSTYVGKATMTAAGNGWYRCSITGTTTAVIPNNLIDIGVTDGTSACGGNAANSVFIYGAQVEAGSFATSYIPTVASQVTRTADQCSIVAPLFAPWYNQSEGTFVASFDMAGGSAISPFNRAVLVARESATSNQMIYNGSSQITGWTVVSNADQAFLTTGALAADTVTNIAYAYKTNDFAASRNGGTVATDTSGTLPVPTALGIGSNSASSLFLSGHIRSIQYYPVRLADFQLQALTA